MTTFNFADLLDIVAAAVPERTAMVCGHETVSYGELKDRVDRLAAALNTLGNTARKVRIEFSPAGGPPLAHSDAETRDVVGVRGWNSALVGKQQS